MVEVSDEMVDALIERLNCLCIEIDDWKSWLLGIPLYQSRKFYDIVRAWVAELTNGVD